MLTKTLLQYRIRSGRVTPLFVDSDSAELLDLAASMIDLVERGLGDERAEVEERLAERAGLFAKPRLAQGLAKLLVDRMTFEEPSDDARALRRETFRSAAGILRALPDEASAEVFEEKLSVSFPDLEARRAALYADLAGARTLLSWKALEPKALLDRYNLALVQGLLLSTRRLTVTADAPELKRVRRVLRWLKFCRLVADVDDSGPWTLTVEGPGEVLSMTRKYGLQLAIFMEAVPLLERWTLDAQVDFGRGRPVSLQLDQTSPLVGPARPLGWIPPELEVVARKLADDEWEVDLTPVPRRVGAGSLCVPDLAVTRRSDGVTLFVEFFHRWHRHALARRLDELDTKPDPSLLLAADVALLSDEALRARVEAHPQAMTFKGFPSERKLRALLRGNAG